jgi:hypothetical protein
MHQIFTRPSKNNVSFDDTETMKASRQGLIMQSNIFNTNNVEVS